MSCDIDFLVDNLEKSARKDSFVSNSLRIVRNVYAGKGHEEGASPGVKKKKKVAIEQLRLLLMRQDFLWHKLRAGADTKERIFNALKQVSERARECVTERASE